MNQEIRVLVTWDWPDHLITAADIRAALDSFAPMYSCQVEELPEPVIEPFIEPFIEPSLLPNYQQQGLQTGSQHGDNPLQVVSNTPSIKPRLRRKIKHRKSTVKPLERATEGING